MKWRSEVNIYEKSQADSRIVGGPWVMGWGAVRKASEIHASTSISLAVVPRTSSASIFPACLKILQLEDPGA